MIIKREDYRGYNAINYSTLAALDRNPSSLVEEKDFSDAMKMGDAVDILMFTPEEFSEKYIYADVEKPTASLLALVEESYNRGLSSEFEINGLIKDLELWSNIKNKETLNKKWDNGLFWKYLEFLNESKGKTVISLEEKDRIDRAVSILKTHEFTKDIFVNGSAQLPIVFYYGGKEYKCLLDYIKFDERHKIIYPYDLKTMSESLRSFPSKVLYWRYDIQSSIYYHGLQEEFPDYKIADFRDIVYSFTSEKPLIFNMQRYIEESKVGFEHNGRNYKGWLELTDELKWHKEKELYEYTKDVYENKGEIIL